MFDSPAQGAGPNRQVIGDGGSIVLHRCEDAKVCNCLSEIPEDLPFLSALVFSIFDSLGRVVGRGGCQCGRDRVLAHPTVIIFSLFVNTRRETQVLVRKVDKAVVESTEYLLLEAPVARIWRRITVSA